MSFSRQAPTTELHHQPQIDDCLSLSLYALACVQTAWSPQACSYFTGERDQKGWIETSWVSTKNLADKTQEHTWHTGQGHSTPELLRFHRGDQGESVCTDLEVLLQRLTARDCQARCAKWTLSGQVGAACFLELGVKHRALLTVKPLT